MSWTIRNAFTTGLAGLGFLAGLGLAGPARAVDPEVAELLKILRERGSLTAAEYESLSGTAPVTPPVEAGGETEQAEQAEVDETEDPSTDGMPSAPAAKPTAAPATTPSATEGHSAVASEPGEPAEPVPLTKEGKTGVEVSLGDKGLEIESKDGNFALAVGGRLQFDGAFSSWDADSKRSSHLNDGVGVRRGRMHMEGTLYHDWDFKYEYDFVRGSGTTAAGITDAFVDYTHFKPFTITVGQFKEPFSLESVTSNRYITFVERSMANNAFVEFANPYLLGVSIQAYGDRWTARGAFQVEPIGNGGYNNNTSVNGQGNANRNGPSGNPTIGGTLRLTALPLFASSAELLHLGFSGSYRSVNNASNGGQSMRFGTQIESVDRSNWADTGNLTNATHRLSEFYRAGVELAGIYESFSFASELMGAKLEGQGYRSGDFLYGYYAYASYFLTGEVRPYNTKAAKFDRLTPRRNFSPGSGGWGAWELATRFDAIDMNTRHVSAGRLQTATAALNWYPNSHLRFMLDYTHVISNHVDTENLTANSQGAALANTSGQHPNIVNLRLQIDW